MFSISHTLIVTVILKRILTIFISKLYQHKVTWRTLVEEAKTSVVRGLKEFEAGEGTVHLSLRSGGVSKLTQTENLQDPTPGDVRKVFIFLNSSCFTLKNALSQLLSLF